MTQSILPIRQASHRDLLLLAPLDKEIVFGRMNNPVPGLFTFFQIQDQNEDNSDCSFSGSHFLSQVN